LNIWGVVLVIGVIGVGMIWPLVLSRREGHGGRSSLAAGAVLVLVGGFLLRLVVVFSSETI
jgi:formate-dependent nitrite reductase membrane component NrfD